MLGDDLPIWLFDQVSVSFQPTKGPLIGTEQKFSSPVVGANESLDSREVRGP